jgi:hypothetical protein
LVEAGPFDIKFAASAQKIYTGGTVDRHQFANHGFPDYRLAPGRVICYAFIRSVPHGGPPPRTIVVRLTREDKPRLRPESDKEPATRGGSCQTETMFTKP